MSNRLSLNTAKTKYIIFKSAYRCRNMQPCHIKIGSKELQQVSTIPYLGITLDSELNWKLHLDNLRRKLSYSCFVLSKARKNFDMATLRTIYFCIFQSHIAYCIEAWGFTYRTYLEPFIILQKRALRFINSAAPGSPSRPLFMVSKIMPLPRLRDYCTSLLVYKIIHNQTPFPSTIFSSPHRNSCTASEGKFFIPPSRNVYGQRCLRYTGVKASNHLPQGVLSTVYKTNIMALKKHFLALDF